MRLLRQVWHCAAYEWLDALRSRRALVVLLLYLTAAICNMYWSINLLSRLERELSSVLQLPESSQTGVVSQTLWQSKPFQRMIRHTVRDKLVLRDITGKHPVELIYAWFAFFYTPLLVVLVAGNRIAEELGSGAVRYAIFRTSRLSWSLGKFLGQLWVVGLALLLSGASAYLVAAIRVHSISPQMLPNMVFWSLRAWIYSIPFLGLALGLSHLTRSASKATVSGIIAIALCFALAIALRHFTTPTGWRSYLPQVGLLLPDGHRMLLWRNSPAALLNATTWLVTLAFCYLMTGCALFNRRDA